MAKTFTVIVGRCDRAGKGSVGFSVRQEILQTDGMAGEGYCRDAKELCRDAQSLCKPGIYVVVRPNFNDLEKDGKIIGFREWRSFNGEPLRQVSFPVPGMPWPTEDRPVA